MAVFTHRCARVFVCCPRWGLYAYRVGGEWALPVSSFFALWAVRNTVVRGSPDAGAFTMGIVAVSAALEKFGAVPGKKEKTVSSGICLSWGGARSFFFARLSSPCQW